VRSIFTWVSAPSFVLALSANASVAHAEANVVLRDRAAWIHLGGRYSGAATDVEVRGRDIVALHEALGPSALVTSGVDRFVDGDTIVRFAQTFRGLPVIGRGAAVRLSRAGQPITTMVDLERDLPAIDPLVTGADAASAASAFTAFGASASDAHLVVWPTLDRGARLAWAVLPRVPAGIPTSPRVIVDAATREILEARDLVTFAKATVFASNPAKSPTASSFDLPIANTGTTLTNDFVQASNCIDNKTVKPVDFFNFKLDVHVCDLEQVATADANGDFVYPPADVAGSSEARVDPFSEVSMYFHASRAYAFFRELQGAPDAQVVVDKPLRVIANLQLPEGLMSGDLAKAANPDLPLQTFQNAFFAPAAGGLGEIFQQLYGFKAGALWFGQGPKRDYAYDGDVVYHELTHAVVDATLKLTAWHADARGAIDAPGAMNEAIADYFSSAITGDPDCGEYAAADMGLPEGQPIRTLVNQDDCSGLVGEVHIDSTLFSGALWSARTSLPESDRIKFDAALYKAMRSSSGNGDLGFEDVAKLFIATLTTDLPAGATALQTSMTARGILPGCERITSFTGAPHVSRDPRIGFVAPGKATVSIKGTAPGIFQLTAPVPENTASVTVSLTVRAAGAANPLGGGGKPFTPLVLAKVGAPITWDPAAKNGHDATFEVAPSAASGAVSAVLELPEGTAAGPIYVQIANTGDANGSYDQVSLAFTPRAVPPVDVPPAPAPEASAPAAEEGCNMGRNSTSTTLFPVLLATAALAAWRRRRGAR
jgi:hypothetical protein